MCEVLLLGMQSVIFTLYCHIREIFTVYIQVAARARRAPLNMFLRLLKIRGRKRAVCEVLLLGMQSSITELTPLVRLLNFYDQVIAGELRTCKERFSLFT